MPKLLEINSTLNWGSTGHIVEQICDTVSIYGWDCYIAHGARYTNKSKYHTLKIGNLFSNYIDVIQSLIFGRHGFGSWIATYFFIKKIEKINPDIIHLHNVHGYYINIKLLFNFLKRKKIPVVWTLHDCWSMTGQCTHFDVIGCEKWKSQCNHCPQLKTGYRSLLFDNSRRNYEEKKRVFNGVDNLTIVTVSDWLRKIVEQSYLNNYCVKKINNGIDLNTFYPIQNDLKAQLNIEGKILLLGVSTGWSEYKGYYDFIKLRKRLPQQFVIVLIGVSKEQREALSPHIIGIERTNNQAELVKFYTSADIFLNPTYNDSFPTTNLEALACGTPIISYRTGGSPESFDNATGIVIEKGDIDSFEAAILKLSKELEVRGNEISIQCRKRAEKLFDKNERFLDYYKLFQSLKK